MRRDASAPPMSRRRGLRSRGRAATAYAVTSTGTPLDAAIQCAMLDITGKACSAPVYRVLGGPTRFKARAPWRRCTEQQMRELASSLAARRQGWLSRRSMCRFLPTTGRNQGQAFDKAARARMDALRAAAPANVNFVLTRERTLMAGDAASVAASLERFHLLWFDEPCPVTNLRTIQKISEETVTPLGFGRDIAQAERLSGPAPRRRRGHSSAQPSSRRHHAHPADRGDGGNILRGGRADITTAVRSPRRRRCILRRVCPNFFIQHIPTGRQDERDRQNARGVAGGAGGNGARRLSGTAHGPGSRDQVNESALEKYKEAAA